MSAPPAAATPRNVAATVGRAAKWIAPAFGFTLIGLSIWVLRRQLRDTSYAEIIAQVHATPAMSVVLALLLATGAYVVLVGYDALALAYIGRSLPLRKVALGSFVAHSMSHSLGFHVITAGSIRFRFWSAWGLSNAEIARALGFASTSFLLGMVLVCGLVLAFEPPNAMALLHLPSAPFRVLGAGLVLGVFTFVFWLRHGRESVRIFGFTFEVPRVRLAVGHLLIAAADWTLAASVAYALLPQGHGVGLLPFTGIFLFALLAGAIGHVPGGVGVLELLMVKLLSPHMAAPGVLGALILYRLIYYVVPFVLGLGFMIVHEVLREGTRFARAATVAVRWIPNVLPFSLSIAVFAAGTTMLLSSAVVASSVRLTNAAVNVPVPVIEVAHFASCILGAALLVYAWFIRRRMQRAHAIVTALLASAIIASLLRGLVWEVAFVMALVLAVLSMSRRLFDRDGSLAVERMSVTWLTGILTVVFLTLWLGLFSFQKIDYTGNLWWSVTFTGDAARFARGIAGAVLFLVIGGTQRWLKRATIEERSEKSEVRSEK